jgi:hypothetical protein
MGLAEMLRLLADEDFNGRILRGLRLRLGGLDVLRAQDVGLRGADDDAVLEWAAGSGRVLLTHDGRTMPGYVRARLAAGHHIPGVFIVDDLAPIGVCVEDVLLIAVASHEGEWLDQVHYLPFSS